MKNFSLKNIAKVCRHLFPFSWKDTGVTIGIILCAYCICQILRLFSESFDNQAMIFFLGLIFVARYTNGYLYDVLASVISVLCVNFAFTYPYYAFNFAITGYPLVFIIMLCISLTVSTLTSRARQRDAMREQVERERMYGNLLRSVSHDIRTPLTSIAGSAAAIIDNKDKFTDEQRDALLSDIHDEAQWLVRSVENILSITRIGDGASGIHKSPELPEEIISSAVARLSKVYPKERIYINLPDSVFFVPMDAVLIEQVVFNLLENAVLHAEGHITIAITLIDRDGEVVFEISDDGCGLSETSKPFFAEALQIVGDRDAKRNMGIGLSVCRSIIKAHGGVLTAKNGESKGTVVSFTLPL